MLRPDKSMATGASGGHTLQEQAKHIDTRIKSLINDNLKEICKAYSLPVSGTKAVLQSRCIGGSLRPSNRRSGGHADHGNRSAQ